MRNSDIFIQFLGGEAPVEAQGTIDGKAFFFHARWDGWSFAIALSSNIDPRDIARSDNMSFYMEGDYGRPGSYDASYMPQADAEKIIRQCTETFLEFIHNKKGG